MAHVADPLAGSYFAETLTNRIEREPLSSIQRIRDMGGMVAAIEKGYPQNETANRSSRFQRQPESGEKVVEGVNKYSISNPKRTMATLYIGRTVEGRKVKRIAELKKRRSKKEVALALSAVREAAHSGKNLCEPMRVACNAYATLQEICDTMREVFGVYREAGSF